jgi:hypothetical protein
VAKGKGASSQDDTYKHQGEWNVETYRELAVRFRKAVEQNNHRKYQPNVVGFPYRTDSVGYDFSLFFPAVRSEKCFQDSGAKVCSGEQTIQQDRNRKK